MACRFTLRLLFKYTNQKKLVNINLQFGVPEVATLVPQCSSSLKSSLVYLDKKSCLKWKEFGDIFCVAKSSTNFRGVGISCIDFFGVKA